MTNRPTLVAAKLAAYNSAPFVAIVVCYVISGILILRSVGSGLPYDFVAIYANPVILTLVYLSITLLLVVGRHVFIARRRPSSRDTWVVVWRRWLGPGRLAGTLVVLAVLPALMNVMLGYRMAITEIQPFRFDELFMTLDVRLHFGQHPWEWLQPVIGHPAVTVLVDRVYILGWFGLLWIGVIWQTVHGREPIRLQFLLALAISWILLGTVAAILFSSAGPVYFARVTGQPDPYIGLVDYLRSVHEVTPLQAVSNQERLWESYRTWGGMTAMPSMHLALSTVVSLAIVRTHRWLLLLVVPLWVTILIGSVHLGWHYAVDSYAGALGAAVIWVACGWFARRWTRGHRLCGAEVSDPGCLGQAA